jgi:hypothetical protein
MVMETGRRFILRLMIVLISLFFIDGGKSLLLVSDNIQIILNQDHPNDFEFPHQHHIVSFSTDEKWLGSFGFDFSCVSNKPVKFLYDLSYPTQDFTDSVWQPPKFI